MEKKVSSISSDESAAGKDGAENSASATEFYKRGNAALKSGDFDRAIADYDQMILLNPNSALAYNGRGSVYGGKGDFDEAIADCNQTILLDPNFAETYFNRGLAYRVKGDLDRAIADYNMALRIQPNHASAKQYLERARQTRATKQEKLSDAIRANQKTARMGCLYMQAGIVREMNDNLIQQLKKQE
jgi:tetratricopeptide (TPR) repeat protein